MQVVVRVKRWDGEKSWLQEYKVDILTKRISVLDVLVKVREEIDPTLAVRYSCRMAICGSCGMVINGRPRLACETLLQNLEGNVIEIEPMWNYPLIRDLVPNLTPLFEKRKLIKPYLIRDLKEIYETDIEFGQKPQELDTYLDFSYCITCGLCYAACPRVAENSKFLGPQALAQAYRWSADSRDKGARERLKIVNGENGVWSCHYLGYCSQVCPRGVEPAFSIQLLKFRLMIPWRR